jgi:hypothetical protein
LQSASPQITTDSIVKKPEKTGRVCREGARIDANEISEVWDERDKKPAEAFNLIVNFN